MFYPNRKLQLITPELKNIMKSIILLPENDRSQWLAKTFTPLILFEIFVLLRSKGASKLLLSKYDVR